MIQSLRIYCIVLLIITGIACNSGNEEKTISSRINPILSRANGFVESNPDSAILLSDYVLRLTDQSDKQDSLYIAAQSIKAQAIRKKGFYDKAYEHLKELIQYAKDVNDTNTFAQLEYQIGYWYYFDNQYLLAKEYLGRASEIFSSSRNRSMQADALLYLGIADLNLGNFEASERALTRAEKYYRLSHDSYKMGLCYMNFGNLMHELKDDNKALNFYQQSVSEFQRSNDSALLASVYVNIGLVYKNKNLDSALYYYSISDNYNTTKSGTITQIINNYNIADIYVLQNRFDKALTNLDWCLEKCIDNNIGDGIPRILSCYASIYVRTNNFPKALVYIDSALVLADSLHLLPVKIKVLDQKINILDSLGRNNEVVALQKQQAILKDSLKYNELQNKLKENDKLKLALSNPSTKKYIKKKPQDAFSNIKIGLLLLVSITLIAVFYFYNRKPNTQ